MKVTIELSDLVVSKLEEFRERRITTFKSIAEDALKRNGEKSYKSWLVRVDEYRNMDIGDLASEYLNYHAFGVGELNG